jgi:putative membrane protein
MRRCIPAATAAAFIAFASLATTSLAQAQSPAAPNTPAKIPSADRSFATKAAMAGTAEIADAKLALKTSKRQDVKDFAQRMVTDHTKAADQLKSIAASQGLTLPSGESTADQKQTDALQKLNGAAFDQKYIRGQRTAHKEAIALFTKESKSGKDGQLKSFASQTLPMLEDHLKMITNTPLAQKSSSIAP